MKWSRLLCPPWAVSTLPQNYLQYFLTFDLWPGITKLYRVTGVQAVLVFVILLLQSLWMDRLGFCFQRLDSSHSHWSRPKDQATFPREAGNSVCF